MRLNNISAVFQKQLKDTFKNKSIMIEFLIFPIVAFVMENAIEIVDMPDRYFAKMFAIMFIGMAPLSSMSAIISEEKEKNTLRVLLTSNVNPREYLFGIGSCIFTVCMAGALVFAMIGRYTGMELLFFLMVMVIGSLTSMMVGSAIGIMCKNQMTANSISVPVMMVFAFLPMLATFNSTIGKVSRITYTQQINNMMNSIGMDGINTENVLVIGINLALAIIVFAIAYKKSGMK